MIWIKRNLFFVISVAVGLLLTGYCSYLLFTSLNDNAGVSDDYRSTLSSLQAIQQKSPFPSSENIQAAKEDQARVRKFLAEFKTRFAPFSAPPDEDEKGFKTYLEESLVRFRAGATNAEVRLPANFDFTFSGLMGKLTYPPDNIGPWMQQMEEISSILNILYLAKINDLVGLCRVPVSTDDAGGSGDCMLQASTVTNQWGVVTPYKITFRGFSAELGAVMEGFARSSNCFIIKAINVVSDKSTMSAAAIAAFAPAQPSPNQPPRRRRREPGSPRPVPGPGVAAPAALGTEAGSTAPPVTFLLETPLLVTISVDVVKLKASEH